MKNSRKQLLISSVSMLLVAILSLSVATYAWFSNRSTALAQGISVKSQVPANILLSLDSADNADWTNRLSLDVHKLNLKPVSTVDCENWFTAYSARFNTSTDDVNGRTNIRQVTTDDWENYYVAKEFYIKAPNSNMTATYVVNVEPANSDYDDDTQIDYLRVALVFETYSTSGEMVEKTSRFYSYDYHSKALEDIDGTIGYTNVTDYVTGNIRLKKGTAQKITLYAWYEGEDPSCIDTKSGVRSVIDVAFTQASGGGVLN
jgi:hypothetical protein